MITVCAITGVDPIGHMEAIERTQRSIPHYTKMEFKFFSGMTLEEYSVFVVKELHKLITTDHVLLCQADGYGRHIELWDDRFTDFDYIGAPFPNGQVGNGGLSLRSRKFLEASARLDSPRIAEDAYLCQYRREELVNSGINFAPVELALRFSYEHPVEGMNWSANDSWGAHGEWNL